MDDEDSIVELYENILSDRSINTNQLKKLAENLFPEAGINTAPDSHLGYDLVICKQGEEAVEAVRKSLAENDPFAVAFIDYRMPPGIDGILAAEQIRKMDENLEIVIVTGYSDVSLEEITQRIPPAHKLLYMQKPFHVQEIRQFASSLSAKWQMEKSLLEWNRSMELKIDERARELKDMNTRLLSEMEEKHEKDIIIKKSEQRYRAILENAYDIIQSISPDGSFIFVNESWKRTLNYTSEDIKGLNFNQILHPESQLQFKMILPKLCKGEDYYNFDAIFITKKMKKVLVEGSFVPYREKGEIRAIDSFFRDVTSKKLAEAELKHSVNSLRKAIGGMIETLTSIVETRDPYTSGHQSRVSDLASAIATELKMEKDSIEGIRIAGIIHDIGKIAIPTELLSKPGKLVDIEFALIKTHPDVGYNLLKKIEFPWPIATIVHQHHERIDGSGYPKGIKKDEILKESCILAVADVVEAMASHRPYRAALGLEKALEEIESGKGILYDPEVVEACITLFREKGFSFK